MDRRKFISGVIIASTATNTLGAISPIREERKFGKPNSLDDIEIKSDRTKSLRLKMRKNELPKKLWGHLERLSEFWEDVSTSPIKYMELRKLAMNGDPILNQLLSQEELNTEEHRALLKLSDPDLLWRAEKGDYVGLLNKMNEKGLLEINNNFSAELLKEAKIDKQYLEAANKQFQLEASIPENNNLIDDILYFKNKVIPSKQQLNVTNNAVAVVGVSVATYVAAAVNVAVSLNVVASISVAIDVAITVSGVCEGYGNLPISDKMKKDLNVVYRLGQRTGRPDIAARALVELHCREAALCLNAAEKLGLVYISEKDKEEVYSRMYQVIKKSMAA
ncbi:hypothetical protein GV054_17545 [Marinomonas mediterranea]|uniref:hypothetical protein n=1 Tax=Marinomonas mediterranea TaxID=119864 RepID=UPI00234B351B|nr:hypothetical protein [Marinomonas mediterranea]WCN14681.1 hypothetical protein GV054_17545 [Marinomonas mediterranea]